MSVVRHSLTPTDLTVYHKESYGQLCQRPSTRKVYRNFEVSVKSVKCIKQVYVEKLLLKQN